MSFVYQIKNGYLRPNCEIIISNLNEICSANQNISNKLKEIDNPKRVSKKIENLYNKYENNMNTLFDSLMDTIQASTENNKVLLIPRQINKNIKDSFVALHFSYVKKMNYIFKKLHAQQRTNYNISYVKNFPITNIATTKSEFFATILQEFIVVYPKQNGKFSRYLLLQEKFLNKIEALKYCKKTIEQLGFDFKKLGFNNRMALGAQLDRSYKKALRNLENEKLSWSDFGQHN